jgi:hypothetical protein
MCNKKGGIMKRVFGVLAVLFLSVMAFSQSPLSGVARNMPINYTVPFVGNPYPGSAETDPDTIYDDSTGLDLTSKNYTPNQCFRGVMVYGSGFLTVYWYNGHRQVIPVTVTEGDYALVVGFFSSIRKTSTCTGIHPLF